MFYMDLWGWIIFGGCMLLSLLASGYVKLRFRRGQAVPLHGGLTGAEVARAILRDQDITNVEVVETEGFLSDHYQPTKKTLNLSADVYHGTDAAAAGVAAHEVGHALQHAQGDLSMWGRTILVYPAHFGAMFAPYLIMIGAGLSAGHHAAHGSGWGLLLLELGIGLFAVATLCSLIIVYNEFNASHRARQVLLRLGIIGSGSEEDATVRGVLTAAGMTYLAAAVTSIAWLVYYLWESGLLGGGRRDD